jgi:hypothetical protein
MQGAGPEGADRIIGSGSPHRQGLAITGIKIDATEMETDLQQSHFTRSDQPVNCELRRRRRSHHAQLQKGSFVSGRVCWRVPVFRSPAATVAAVTREHCRRHQ